jgi:hypothetical protein
VLIVGGYPVTTDCVTINVVTQTCERKAAMIHARDTPGVVSHDGNVYVFGSDPETTTAEVFSVAENKWTALPDTPCHMNDTNATLHEDSIFIAC